MSVVPYQATSDFQFIKLANGAIHKGAQFTLMCAKLQRKNCVRKQFSLFIA